MQRVVLATLMIAAAAPAAATITQVDFRGSGVVTYSRVGGNPEPGSLSPEPPAIGAPVTITGRLDLGIDGVADDFTGVFVFDPFFLHVQAQGFGWGVVGGNSGASTFFGNFASANGTATFTGGRLTNLNLYVDYDGDDHSLGGRGWSSRYSYQDAEWGGTSALAIPEPSGWALLIAGFGLVGTAARRSRTRAARA